MTGELLYFRSLSICTLQWSLEKSSQRVGEPFTTLEETKDFLIWLYLTVHELKITDSRWNPLSDSDHVTWNKRWLSSMGVCAPEGLGHQGRTERFGLYWTEVLSFKTEGYKVEPRSRGLQFWRSWSLTWSKTLKWSQELQEFTSLAMIKELLVPLRFIVKIGRPFKS